MKRFVSLVLSVCFLFSINTVSYAANTSSRRVPNQWGIGPQTAE